MLILPRLALIVLFTLPLSLRAEVDLVPDPQWQVARAQFTSRISNREPVDRVVVATPLMREVYFFTDLRHLQGRTVTHRWKYEGEVVSQVPFEVDGPRWRVNSKKEIEPEQVGEWSVTVLDESGWPLYTELFRYENGAPLLQSPDVSGSTGQGESVEPGLAGPVTSDTGSDAAVVLPNEDSAAAALPTQDNEPLAVPASAAGPEFLE